MQVAKECWHWISCFPALIQVQNWDLPLASLHSPSSPHPSPFPLSSHPQTWVPFAKDWRAARLIIIHRSAAWNLSQIHNCNLSSSTIKTNTMNQPPPFDKTSSMLPIQVTYLVKRDELVLSGTVKRSWIVVVISRHCFFRSSSQIRQWSYQTHDASSSDFVGRPCNYKTTRVQSR